MNKCRECGARSTEHCARWDCPDLQIHECLYSHRRDPVEPIPACSADVRMNSPLDWDYADIRRRMQALHPPPFSEKNGQAGNHCDHCLEAAEERCHVSCRMAYRKRYGVEPS